MLENFLIEKRIIKKIIIAIVFVFMFNFTFANLGNNIVFAAEDGEVISDTDMDLQGGGKLLLPIQKLLVFLSDAALELLQRSFVADLPVTITARADTESEINGAAIAGIVIGVVVLGIACVVTYGAAAGIVGAVGTATATATGAVATAGAAAIGIAQGVATYGGMLVGGLFFAGGSVAGIVYSTDKLIDDIKGEFELPTIQYSPEEIFANRIPMFDINFFEPQEVDQDNSIIVNKVELNSKDKDILIPALKLVISNCTETDFQLIKKVEADGYSNPWKEYMGEEQVGLYIGGTSTSFIKRNDETSTGWDYESYYNEKLTESLVELSKGMFNDPLPVMNIWVYNNQIYLSNQQEFGSKDHELYKMKINKDNSGNIKIKPSLEYVSSADILQETVSSMYKSLRIVAIVALLTILVYVGIRMVISSAAKDKAKYKQMLMDWLVALIMVFVLHYIMAFIINISTEITGICNKSNIENVPIKIPNGTRLKDDESESFSERLDQGDSGADVWSTNFIGAIRFYAGLVQKRGYTMKGIMYTIMYMVLVIYTVMFTFQYMKRVLYMAFLTMIAPLIAITYPLDKINDGKAQGFSLWLKEYIFNALLQPIHYIIYVVIMGSAMELVIKYPVYGLVALGFMIPAEKFIRKMFGFEKAGTVGAFGGAVGAAMLMGGIQKLTHRPHGDKGGGSSGSSNGEKDGYNSKIRSIDGKLDTDDINLLSKNSRQEVEQIEMPIDENGMISQQNEQENTRSRSTPQVSTESVGTPNPQASTERVGTPNPTITEKDSSTKKQRLIQGLGAVAGHYKRRMANGTRNFKPLRALRRGLTYGIGAGTLGVIGLAAGIASGDPSKALQYTMAGGIAGGNLGRNLGESASNLIGLEGAGNAFTAGYFGADYGDIERARHNKEFKGNASNYETALRKVSSKGWTEMTKDGGIVDEALDYGITDIGTMCNIYKTKEKLIAEYHLSESEAQKYAFKAYKMSKKYGDIGSNSKTEDNLRKILARDGNEAAYPIMRNLIRFYNDISLE